MHFAAADIADGGKTCNKQCRPELTIPAESDCMGRGGPLNLNVNLSGATCPGACCGAAGVGLRVAAVVLVLLPGLQQTQHGVSTGERRQHLNDLATASPSRRSASYCFEGRHRCDGKTPFSMQPFKNALPVRNSKKPAEC